MPKNTLNIHEIFYSIQGESSKSGLPCVFIRLRGCPLRCHYCDTSYAFKEGACMQFAEIIERIQSFGCNLVEITGGEPLMQSQVHALMEQLCDLDFEVLLETCGQLPIAQCDARVKRIIDIKTPNSGASYSFLQENYGQLKNTDEVKFVITNKEDFDWSLQTVRENVLFEKVAEVHFSPVMFQEGNSCIQGCAALAPEILAGWILDSGENVRLHLQLHRYVWAPDARGV
ncbi:MAG: 7-carboxy-7-deazaguanine synthase [Phycisphaerae bacterium]|nr:7-carboxy-7-deazaguanine synthase [Phycisphaerae bacterium]